MSNLIYPVQLRGRGQIRMVPMHRTVIAEYESGMEQRDRRWLRRRFRFEIAYPVVEQDAENIYRTLSDFLLLHGGRHESFLFEDWTTFRDYGAYGRRLNEQVGVGNGARVLFGLYENQLTSASIYLDGVLQSSGYTLDPATGKVTFTAAPAVGVKVTASVEGGLFRVRSDTDEPTYDRVHGIGWAITVPLIQVREDA